MDNLLIAYLIFLVLAGFAHSKDAGGPPEITDFLNDPDIEFGPQAGQGNIDLQDRIINIVDPKTQDVNEYDGPTIRSIEDIDASDFGSHGLLGLENMSNANIVGGKVGNVSFNGSGQGNRHELLAQPEMKNKIEITGSDKQEKPIPDWAHGPHDSSGLNRPYFVGVHSLQPFEHKSVPEMHKATLGLTGSNGNRVQSGSTSYGDSVPHGRPVFLGISAYKPFLNSIPHGGYHNCGGHDRQRQSGPHWMHFRPYGHRGY